MKRLYSLDLLKLVFAYVIAFFHFGSTIPPGPTVTVQIFFFISGFFLARKYYTRSHADGGRAYSPWQYTLDHAKGIYPHYLFSYAAFLLYNLARAAVYFLKSPGFAQLQEIVLSWYEQIPNLLFLQSAYYFHDSMNYPLWQLSALMIAGYFVYALLCFNERQSRYLLFPGAILMLLSLQHSGVPHDGTYGFVFMPLLRAFAGLGFGVLLYCFTTTPLYEALRARRTAFNLAAILSLLCIFVYAEHANIHYVTAALLILGCYDPTSWLNRLLNLSLFRHAGKLSLSIYVNHALLCRFVNAWLLPHTEGWGFTLTRVQENGIYFLLLTGYSVFTLFFVEWLLARRKRPAIHS